MTKCETKGCKFKSEEGFKFNQGIDGKIRCNKCLGIELIREEDEN